MIIFSERVNGMYRDVRKSINEKSKETVQQLVREQVAGGADVLDINLGPTKGDPVENFVWLAQTVNGDIERAVVGFIPIASVPDVMNDNDLVPGEGDVRRRLYEGYREHLVPITPVCRAPKVDPRRMAIISGEFDQLCC